MSWAINTGTSRRGRKHNKRKRMPNVYLASTGAYTWGLAKIQEVEEVEEEVIEEVIEIVPPVVEDPIEIEESQSDD